MADADNPNTPPPTSTTSRSSSTWRPGTYENSRDAEAAFLTGFREDPGRDAGRPESAQAEQEQDEPQDSPMTQRRQARAEQDEPAQDAPEDFEAQDDAPQDAEIDDSEEADPGADDTLELDADQLADVLGIPVTATDEGELRVQVSVDGKPGDATLAEVLNAYQRDAHLTNRGKALSEREKTVADRAETIEQQATAAENLMATLYQAIESLNPYANFQSDDQTEILLAKNNERDFRSSCRAYSVRRNSSASRWRSMRPVPANSIEVRRWQSRLNCCRRRCPAGMPT